MGNVKNSKQRVNKSEWIRQKPVSVPAKDLVDMAKKEGITLSLAQVYTARSAAKKAQAGGEKRKPGRPAGTGKTSTSKASASNGLTNEVQQQFVRLAVRIGTDEAKRLLDRIVEQQRV